MFCVFAKKQGLHTQLGKEKKICWDFYSPHSLERLETLCRIGRILHAGRNMQYKHKVAIKKIDLCKPT